MGPLEVLVPREEAVFSRYLRREAGLGAVRGREALQRPGELWMSPCQVPLPPERASGTHQMVCLPWAYSWLTLVPSPPQLQSMALCWALRQQLRAWLAWPIAALSPNKPLGGAEEAHWEPSWGSDLLGTYADHLCLSVPQFPCDSTSWGRWECYSAGPTIPFCLGPCSLWAELSRAGVSVLGNASNWYSSPILP